MATKYNHIYLIQQRNCRHLIKKQHVGLVNIIPALQKVTVIPISDLKNNPK